jgi:hypothetical protein
MRQAAAHVRLTVGMPEGSGLVLRFGDQLDTQTVNSGPTGQLTPEHAARYIAKYATKSTEDFGLGERRITLEALPLLDATTTCTGSSTPPGNSANTPPTRGCGGGST